MQNCTWLCFIATLEQYWYKSRLDVDKHVATTSLALSLRMTYEMHHQICALLRTSSPWRTFLNCHVGGQIQVGWNDFATSQCAHCRSIQNQSINIPRLPSIFSKFEESQKKVLLLNTVDGFQSEFCKATWASDADDKCPLCGQVGRLDHGMLHCPNLDGVQREHFADIVKFVFFGLSSPCVRFPHFHVLQTVFMSIGSAPEHVPLQIDIAHLRFCTDGGCD